MRRVVITGLGTIAPLGHNVSEFWGNLLAGVSGAGIISRFDATSFNTRFACEVKNYDPLNYFDKKELRRIDRFGQYGIIAANEAIADSGITKSDIPAEKIGVIMSTGIGGFESFENDTIDMRFMDGVPKPGPFFITKFLANSLGGEISIRYQFRGVNYSPVSACASSTQAVIHAFNYVRTGQAECIVAGGSEAPIIAPSIAGFNAIRALSTNNENFSEACRPFDADRDGFILGEGSAVLMVESLDSALKRGAKIYAEIIGGSEMADAFHATGTHPEGVGAKLAMNGAIQAAGINPDDIDYVNAHATSTIMGDPSEIIALESVFGPRKKKLSISATKSMTGHLLGAAGAIEALSTVLAVNTNKIPPTINTKSIDIDMPSWIDPTLGASADLEVNYAISNSFGFGGHCACATFKKYK